MYIYYHFVFSTRCSLRYIRVVFFPMNNITLSGDYIFFRLSPFRLISDQGTILSGPNITLFLAMPSNRNILTL